MHVPVPDRVAVVPDTVQTLEVSEVKLTARPELAVALRADNRSARGDHARDIEEVRDELRPVRARSAWPSLAKLGSCQMRVKLREALNDQVCSRVV